jgi:transcription antitermination factor NusG
VTPRPIFAEPWQPLWFVLIVPPQGELTATAWLARYGVEAWYPTTTVHARQPRPPHKWLPRIRPVCTGYLFANMTRRPIWDYLFAQSHGKIRDVMRIGERPVAIGETELMAMQEVPERLRQMREAVQEAARIRPGDHVTITQGGMAGWHITVDSVDGGVVRFTAPGGFPGQVEMERVAK